ncbi:MAG: sodium-independent anion transporter, partial [Methanomicrobiales archaeon]|nr:sodium-independent anion transporter [Methanomicrobiales archaeon]
YKFDAPLFFANASYFSSDLSSVLSTSEEPVRYLLLDAEAITDPDSSASDMLRELVEELHEKKIIVGITGAGCMLIEMIHKTGIEEIVGLENIFPTIRSGIIAFGERYLEDQES